MKDEVDEADEKGKVLRRFYRLTTWLKVPSIELVASTQSRNPCTIE